MGLHFYFKFLIALSIIIIALVTGAYFVFFTSEKKETARVEINGVDFAVEVAKSQEARQIGLGNRDRIPEFGGMLFLFPNEDRHAFWMKNMRFPIDILWIDGSAVVDTAENVEPSPAGASDSSLTVYRPRAAADKVLEINAGLVKKHGIKIGNRVILSSVVVENNEELVLLSNAKEEKKSPPPLGSEFFISTLQARRNTGSDFKIEKPLEENAAYRKFAVSYKSGELKLTGVMNVPRGVEPKEGFPVLILNHGLIPPEIYFSGRGSKREQDFFVRNGYITIHPDYRGLASSSPHSAEHHDFYVGYTEDVVALIDAIKALKSNLLDADRIGVWGHSMGGGIAARVAVLRPEVRAFILFAPISADVEDNFYELSKDEVDWLRNVYGRAGSEIYRRISPLDYFQEVSAPFQLHHGGADKDVPIEFSEKMQKRLSELKKTVEFYRYPGEPHEFVESWPLAAERALQFFDRYVKNIK